MQEKFAEALELFRRNFLLFAALSLTIWLPGNALASALRHVLAKDSLIPGFASLWISAVFGPLYVGALLYAVLRRKQGEPVRYAEALRFGVSHWPWMFAATLVAHIVIAAGFLALIIPGIYLSLRFAFVSEAVALEGCGVREALRNSGLWTAGRKLRLLAATLFFTGMYLALYVVLSAPLETLKLAENPIALCALGCVLSVSHSFLYILVFLFYWEERGHVWAAPAAEAAGETP